MTADSSPRPPRPRPVSQRQYWVRRVTALSILGTFVALAMISSGTVASAETESACVPAATTSQAGDSVTPQQSTETCEPATQEPTTPPPSEPPPAEQPPAEQPPAEQPAAGQPAPTAPPADKPSAQKAPAPTAPADEAPVGAPDTHQDSGSQARPRRGERRGLDRARGRARSHPRRNAARGRALARRRAAQRKARLRARREADRRSGRDGRPVRPSVRLPDPLPAAARLDPGFARELARASRREGVSWALVLAVLRARGHDDATPTTRAGVRALARQLARLGGRRHPVSAAIALTRASSFDGPLTPADPGSQAALAERIVALTRYHSAVGLEGLTRGLAATKSELIYRVLQSRRLSIYPGGRGDVQAGRIDVRVLVLMLYLAGRYEEVTVTSLETGHGVFTSSGNVSQHSVGLAVDIAALNGISILGNQQPGGITERALAQMLLLPPELRPKQLISLFEFGGPSFAMADHHDHIHAGY